MAAEAGSTRGAALAAIDGAQAGFGATSYRAAMNAAADQLKGRRGTIVVVTDLLENGWDAGERAAVPESARIEVVDVGALPANLSVRALRVDGDRVIATIHNQGPQARDAEALRLVALARETVLGQLTRSRSHREQLRSLRDLLRRKNRKLKQALREQAKACR